MWGHGKKAAVLKPGRRFSPETELASTFILDFSATGTVRNECGLFKLLSLWHFLIAAYAKIILIHTMSHWSRRSLKFFPAKITYNCAISYVKLHCQVNIARPLLKGALKKINVGHLKQRMRWLDSISDSTDMNLSKLQEIVEDRGAWLAFSPWRCKESDVTSRPNNNI